MKPNNYVFLSLCYWMFFLPVIGFSQIHVHNPLQPWSGARGIIEDAQVTFHPRGLYMEVGLYLTISAKGTHFETQDSINLEARLRLTLPDNVMVHDSWLWIGEDIIQADISEIDAATEVYEDIVDRVEDTITRSEVIDPSILYKSNSPDVYEMNIFPLKPDSTRRLKITYLAPIDISAIDYGRVKLPPIIHWSNKDAQIQIFTNEEWVHPQIVECPEVPFEFVNHPVFGEFYLTYVNPVVKNFGWLDLSLQHAIKNGIYLNTYKEDQESFYQLSFLPSEVYRNTRKPKKIALLLDFTYQNSVITGEYMLSETKKLLKSHLLPTDSFNIITNIPNYPNLDSKWISATNENIDRAFKDITPSILHQHSHDNLKNLISGGIIFTKLNPPFDNVQLFLFSNTHETPNPTTSLEWNQQFIKMMGTDTIPISIINYKNYPTYVRRDGLYGQLAEATKGHYYFLDLREGITQNFPMMGSKLFRKLQEDLNGTWQINTSLENGKIIDSFNYPKDNFNYSDNKVFTQVGKFTGTPPFVIESVKTIGDNIFRDTFKIMPDDTISFTQKNKAIWAGQTINHLEQAVQSEEVIDDILKISINNRILSTYTAFLALEIALGGRVCYSCVDVTAINEDFSTSIGEIVVDSLIEITAVSNPFRENTTIKVKLEKEIDFQHTEFTIYDINSKVVKIFSPPFRNVNEEIHFFWDGTHQDGQRLKSGIYLFNVKTNKGQKHLKLLFLS